MYPNILKKSKKKIFSKPTLEYEYIQNLTLVQEVFFTIKEKKDLEIQKVIFNQMAKLKILINFEFLKWFYIWVERKKIEKEGGEVIDNR